jgi:hypothetical protein
VVWKSTKYGLWNPKRKRRNQAPMKKIAFANNASHLAKGHVAVTFIPVIWP